MIPENYCMFPMNWSLKDDERSGRVNICRFPEVSKIAKNEEEFLQKTPDFKIMPSFESMCFSWSKECELFCRNKKILTLCLNTQIKDCSFDKAEF